MNTCLQEHVLFPGFIEAARRLDTASFFCLLKNRPAVSIGESPLPLNPLTLNFSNSYQNVTPGALFNTLLHLGLADLRRNAEMNSEGSIWRLKGIFFIPCE